MSTSHAHLTRLVLTIAAVGAVSVALTGTATAHAPGAPEPSTHFYSDLYRRVLAPVELPGFYTIACPALEASRGRWEMREHLLAKDSADAATSAVTRFASISGASQQLDRDLARARRSAGFAAFSVAGIPGARGYSRAIGSTTSRLSVEFAGGPYLYLAAVDVSPRAARAIRARLLASMLHLYRRVQRLA